MSTDRLVYVVDDDEAVREALCLLVESVGLTPRGYDTAEHFLAAYDSDTTACVLMDMRMPGMSGLECQRKLADIDASTPIIFLTGHGDVPAAVKALKNGAIDFLQKPVSDEQTLLDRIDECLSLHERRRAAEAKKAEISERLEQLTERERQVLQQVAAGKANKVIAYELDISERTVEIHRGRGMRKLGIRNIAELVRMLQTQPRNKSVQ